MRFKVIRTRLASRRNDIRTHSDRVRAEAAEGVPCPKGHGTFQFPLLGVEGIGIGETDDFYLWLCYNIQERHERG